MHPVTMATLPVRLNIVLLFIILTAACITAVVFVFLGAILEEQFINNNANLILLNHFHFIFFFCLKY